MLRKLSEAKQWNHILKKTCGGLKFQDKNREAKRIKIHFIAESWEKWIIDFKHLYITHLDCPFIDEDAWAQRGESQWRCREPAAGLEDRKAQSHHTERICQEETCSSSRRYDWDCFWRKVEIQFETWCSEKKYGKFDKRSFGQKEMAKKPVRIVQ